MVAKLLEKRQAEIEAEVGAAPPLGSVCPLGRREQVFSSFPWPSRSGSLPLRFLGLLRFVQLANESERSHNNNMNINVSSGCK